MWTVGWCIVHNVHNVMTRGRGQNARGQSVGHVDSLDVRFKSLYPFCLFFKQRGFCFIEL